MDTSNINELLDEAMNSELKAREFYEQAATKAQSQAGKQFFKELAEFEQNHYERVRKIIESRRSGLTIDSSEPSQDIPMIDAEIKGEFEPNKNEIIDVINKAIEAEKDAQERYTKIADMIDDGKEIFTTLANEERNHQKILEDEFYHISNTGTIIWGE